MGPGPACMLRAELAPATGQRRARAPPAPPLIKSTQRLLRPLAQRNAVQRRSACRLRIQTGRLRWVAMLPLRSTATRAASAVNGMSHARTRFASFIQWQMIATLARGHTRMHLARRGCAQQMSHFARPLDTRRKARRARSGLGERCCQGDTESDRDCVGDRCARRAG